MFDLANMNYRQRVSTHAQTWILRDERGFPVSRSDRGFSALLAFLLPDGISGWGEWVSWLRWLPIWFSCTVEVISERRKICVEYVIFRWMVGGVEHHESDSYRDWIFTVEVVSERRMIRVEGEIFSFPLFVFFLVDNYTFVTWFFKVKDRTHFACFNPW